LFSVNEFDLVWFHVSSATGKLQSMELYFYPKKVPDHSKRNLPFVPAPVCKLFDNVIQNLPPSVGAKE
jgi:hypothetical protein